MIKIENKFYIFNAHNVKNGVDALFFYDAMKFASAMQGLLNRESPVLFIDYRKPTDKFWLDYISSENKFLHGRDFIYFDSFASLFDAFGDFIKSQGLAVWDKNVNSTANAALTVCGVKGWLPVCEGEFFDFLTNRYEVKIELDLRGKFTGKGAVFNTDKSSTGSAKCDAYIYALENFMDQNSDSVMGYVMDGFGREWIKTHNSDIENTYVPNADYLVAHKAFCFELSPWDDELPCDDGNQPMGTDYETFRKILTRQAEKNNFGKITSVVGFTPWQAKYTEHENKSVHGAVATEWRHAELLSAHNCIMDADAYGYCGLFNASVYRFYPLKSVYKNNRPKTMLSYDKNKTYVSIYMGDYDSAVWLTIYSMLHFNDKERGKYPMTWCFNPNLSDRAPMVFDYVYENKTENDYFESGDSGAGYLNPSLLCGDRIFSGFAPAKDLWIEHNKKYFGKFDMDFVGFIINGVHKFNGEIFNMYADFTKGCGHNGYHNPVNISHGVPFIGHLGDLPGNAVPDGSEFGYRFNENDVSRAAQMIIDINKQKVYNNFMMFRTILWTPKMYNSLIEEVKEKDPANDYVFCDPYNFFSLLKNNYADMER